MTTPATKLGQSEPRHTGTHQRFVAGCNLPVPATPIQKVGDTFHTNPQAVGQSGSAGHNTAPAPADFMTEDGVNSREKDGQPERREILSRGHVHDNTAAIRAATVGATDSSTNFHPVPAETEPHCSTSLSARLIPALAGAGTILEGK